MKKILSLALAGALGLTSGAMAQDQDNLSRSQRIAGASRYETTAQVSSRAFDSAKLAVVASGEGYADALAGSALAKAYSGPVLLTSKASLDPNVKNELRRLGVEKIYILGGESSISKNVEKDLSSLAKTERISGSNRYETAAKVADQALKTGRVKEIGLASGQAFADALSAGSYVNSKDAVLLLTDGKDLDDDSKDLIERNPGLRKVAFGGKNQISDALVSKLGATRIAGADRYDTSLKIAMASLDDMDDFDDVILVSGTSYPDALSAFSLLVGDDDDDSVILLVPEKSLSKDLARLIRGKATIVGGPNTVAGLIEKQIDFDDDDWDNFERSKASRISEDKALDLALKKAGLSRSSIRDLEIDLDYDDGRLVDEIEFEVGDKDYEFEIEALTGAFIKVDLDGDGKFDDDKDDRFDDDDDRFDDDDRDDKFDDDDDLDDDYDDDLVDDDDYDDDNDDNDDDDDDDD